MKEEDATGISTKMAVNSTAGRSVLIDILLPEHPMPYKTLDIHQIHYNIKVINEICQARNSCSSLCGKLGYRRGRIGIRRLVPAVRIGAAGLRELFFRPDITSGKGHIAFV